ncbi:Na/Pi symporter [Marivirga sericea]|uniref:Na/Pi symporter n=1 Tax=Marivirga sericea TaxID=1028 RepID=UPI001FE45B8B|nr:Na/Pi symporter [Marivirga sericea]
MIASTIFLFLLAIDFIGYSFRLLNKDIANSIINLTANPFISLFIGLLITAIIQSSSTSTSMIVAIVASGSLEFSDAIPMIMGANIGTTLTSTLVSLSFITNRDEFRKAIGAGVVHDFFNILVVAILFPLEYNYGVLTNLSSEASNFILGADYVAQNTEFRYFLFTKPIVLFIGDLIPYPVILAIASFVMLAIAVKFLSKTLYKSITGGSREFLQRYFFGSPYRSFFWGIIFTAGVQSSSVTTSVIVPFVATRKISLKQSFTFILGANIGTTITALIAALFKSEAAVSIALVHLFFNLIGVLIFLPFPFIRSIPVRMAKSFGRLAMKFRIAGFVYIILTFFLIPFILISFSREGEESAKPEIEMEKELREPDSPADSFN